jgi:hypothetical protein
VISSFLTLNLVMLKEFLKFINKFRRKKIKTKNMSRLQAGPTR